MVSYGQSELMQVEQHLKRMGIDELTPIQKQVLEKWQETMDVIGLAPTGSGKTLAFALASVAQLDDKLYRPQILVLCPTRELAQQVARVFQLATQSIANVQIVSLVGGDNIGSQIKALKGACQVVVGTPGRTLDHLEKRRLVLEHVHTRILDEADRMVEMGMREEVEAIFRFTPDSCRTGLFSATYPQSVAALASTWLRKPISIDVREEAAKPDIVQQVFKVEKDQKSNALCALLTDKQTQKCIVFCQTKKATQRLFEHLVEKGFSATQIQGDMQQEQRQRAIMKLTLDAATVLVATDVAARGLDLPDVDLVISYDLSDNPDTHVHRIGRTGRAGKVGEAVIFASGNEVSRAMHYCDQSEQSKVSGLQHLRFHANRIAQPVFASIEIKGGKRDKLRKGDLVGALTQDAGLPSEDIGAIVLTANLTFVGVKLRSVKRALRHFKQGKIKGRRYMASRF